MRNLNFIDYIKSGVRIKLSIGIDYTESNLSPTDPKSLHYLGENMKTIIMIIIRNFQFMVMGHLLMDKDQLICALILTLKITLKYSL